MKIKNRLVIRYFSLFFFVALSVLGISIGLLYAFKITNNIPSVRIAQYTCEPTTTEYSSYLSSNLSDLDKENKYRLLESYTKEIAILIDQYQQSEESEQKSALVEQIGSLAQERKSLLVEILAFNPGLVYANILSNENKAFFDAMTNNCSPEIQTAEGYIESYTFESIDGNSEDIRLLDTKTNESLTLHVHFARDIESLFTSGTKVQISGYKLDNHLLVDGKDDQSITLLESPDLAKEAQGEQNILVLLTNNAANTLPSLENETVEEVFFETLGEYINENSYEKASITGEIRDLGIINPTPLCQPEEIIHRSLQDVNVDNFDHIFIMSPLYECPWYGFSSTGKIAFTRVSEDTRASISILANGRMRLNTVGHLFGHNLGLDHSNFQACSEDGLCTEVDYGDPYTLMGEKTNNGHLTGAHKELLGWIEPEEIVTVSSDQTFTLSAFENINAETKLVKIPQTNEDYLYLELRRPIGFDQKLAELEGSNVFDGLLIHQTDKKNKTKLISTKRPATTLDAALEPGESFIDTLTGTQINVNSIQNDTLEASVVLGTIENFDADITLTQPTNNTVVNGTIDIAISSSDLSKVTKVEYYQLGVGNPFASTENDPYSIRWDTTKVPNGTKRIYARAYGTGANQVESDIVTFIVENDDNQPPTITLDQPKDGATSENPIQINAIVSDDSGVDRVEYFKDNESIPFYISKFSHNFTYTFSEGSRSLYAIAYDFSGKRTTSNTVRFDVIKTTDSQAPTLSILSPAANVRFRNQFTISAEASDLNGIEKVEFYLDSANQPFATDTQVPYQQVVDTRTLQDGNHTFTVYAYDTNGNRANQSVPFFVDNTNPTLSITQPTNNEVVSGEGVLIEARAQDNIQLSRVNFFINDILVRTLSSSPYFYLWNTTNVPNGTNSITVEAVDTTNNTVTEFISVNVTNDIPNPSTEPTTQPSSTPTASPISSTEPSPQPTTAPSPTPTSIPISSPSPVSSPQPSPTPTNSPIADANPPSVSIINPQNNTVIIPGTTLNITANASDDQGINRVEFYIGGALRCTDFSAPYSCAWNVPSANNKQYTLSVTAYDNANNFNATTISVTSSR